jgi:hypothetical protein
MKHLGCLGTRFAALAMAALCGACNLVVGIEDVPPATADDGGGADATGDVGPAMDATQVETGGGEAGGDDVTNAPEVTTAADASDAANASDTSTAMDSATSADVEGDVTTADPCAVANGGCASNATCAPAVDGGTRTCTCPMGYSGDGLTCTPINACLTSNGGCDANATCTNTGPGTRTCACNSGYMGDGMTCTGIQACAMNNGGCAPTAKCTSTGPNTRTCMCNPGYSGDGMTCSAINSCATNNGGCSSHATCTSTGPGTNTCACNSGYTGDGMTCTAINSCATNNGGCSTNATCTSTGPGTNSCACNSGYSGNGMTCTAIDSCATNNGGCTTRQTCTSTGPGTNTCACMTDPVCSSTGNVCVNSTAYTCSKDAQGCYYQSGMMTCGAGKMCSGGQCLVADGYSCVNPTDCFSGVCTTFYIDQDGDKHGAASGPSRYCGTTAPAGYVTSSDDCCDNPNGGANIFPGQGAWFTNANTACPAIGWDYNCDGNIEQEVTQLDPACVPNPASICPAGRQWYGLSSPPACGQSGNSNTCIDLHRSDYCGSSMPALYTQGCH